MRSSGHVTQRHIKVADQYRRLAACLENEFYELTVVKSVRQARQLTRIKRSADILAERYYKVILHREDNQCGYIKTSCVGEGLSSRVLPVIEVRHLD